MKTIEKLLWPLLIVSLLLNAVFIGIKFKSYFNSKPKKVLSENTREGLTRDIFNFCPNDSSEIIFLGNSITAGFKVDEFFPDHNVKNRGIWGDKTSDMLDRIHEIVESKPKKVFILAGINDIIRNIPLEVTLENLDSMILTINNNSPETKIYIQSILPLTRHASYYFFNDENVAYKKIAEANEKIRRLCNLRHIDFVSIDNAFTKERELNEIYSWDGIHLNGKGYLMWFKQIERFVVE